ncbi:unnamed protein product [Oikopleura dioica]|uniref:Uncharacterized protein n=1 Tax=Oikopleura dioica TaxID=34765 RepID=E4WSH3_OIKDI|nr:unnamed protein product [Oikopleura dioica]
MPRPKSVILVTSPKKRSQRTERSRNLRRYRRRSPLRRRERSPQRSRPSRRRFGAPSRDTEPRRSRTPKRRTPPRSPTPPLPSPLTSSSDEDEDVIMNFPIPKTPSDSPPREEPKEVRPPPPPPPKKRKEEVSLQITRHDVQNDVHDDDEIPNIVADYLRRENRRKRRAERKANRRRKKIREKILEDAAGNDVRLIKRDRGSILETHGRVVKLLTLLRHHAIRRRINSAQFWTTSKSKPLRVLITKLATGPFMCLFLNFINGLKQSYETKKKNQQQRQ